MNRIRRLILKTGSLGLLLLNNPLRVLADWNTAAFDAEEYDQALQELYQGQNIETSDAIKISIHSSVENGAVVPIKVETDLTDISTIDILIEKNPNPLIARFEMHPRCDGFVSTRLKFDLPSDVIVVVNSGGKLFKQQTFVEVLEGGCG